MRVKAAANVIAARRPQAKLTTWATVGINKKQALIIDVFIALSSPSIMDTESERSVLQSQRRALPIASARNAILREIRLNDCCIVVGETGSGKTTQIPQVHS